MSDYLSNLVARTLSLEPVVQPRLASLFEPASITAGRIPAAPFETETLFADLPSAEPTLRSSAAVPAAARVPPQRHVTGTIEENAYEPAARAAADQIATDSASSPLPAPLVPRAVSIQFPSVPIPQLVHHGPSASDTESNQERAVSNESISEQRRPRHQVEEARQRTGERSTRLEPTSPAPRSRPKQSPRVRGSTSRLTIDGPTNAPRNPAPRIVRELSAAGEPAPTIKVTIGRVDVRAIMSPQSQPARVARAPRTTPTSLDEYLKKQSEGRR